MFSNSDFKMAFGLSIIGSIAATTLTHQTSPESTIIGNLSLKVKKFLTLADDVKTIFKLQDVNLSLSDFSKFFRTWNEVLSKNGNLTKTFLSGAFQTITVGVYNLLRNDLIHKPMKFKG